MKTNSKFSVSEIKDFVSSLNNRTQFGLAAVVVTTPDLKKPKSCPFSGRVKK